MQMGQVKNMEEASVVVDNENWVCDHSSVDHKGRVPFRSSTGAWKAALFILAIEFGERMCYFGLATSLIIYLTKVIHQDLKTAAKNVNCWSGVTATMPLLGAFLADAYIGQFAMVLFSFIFYLLGLLILTLSRVTPGIQPSNMRVHEIVFLIGIYLISIGTGGYRPSVECFGADQFDEDHPTERKQRMSFFNWFSFGLCSGLIFGVTVIVYVQDHISWAAADVILIAVMASCLLIFCLGRPFYRFRQVKGSPLTPMLHVLVAAIAKRKLPYPSETHQLYEVKKSDNTHGRLLSHTNKLKFLDKAAIIEHTVDRPKAWRLATVTRVEEVKLIINMVPIWLTTLPFGICVAQSSTFFIKQGTTLNHNISRGVTIPPASMFALVAIGMIVSITVYEKVLVPFLRRVTGNERGLNFLQRIGIGMVFSVTAMVVAALVERKRLKLVQTDPHKGSVSMSVFWLAPQFIIIGIGDSFTLVGLQEYFYDQVPDSMRSLGLALYLSVIGVSSFASSFLITVVDHLTGKSGKSWIGKDLNSSRLDCFYWLLAGITALNLGIYAILSRKHSYKSVTTVAVADCNEDNENIEGMA